MSSDLIKTEIKIEDEQVKALLTRLQEKMADMAPVMRRIAKYMVSSIQQNFEVGGRYSAPGSWMGGSRKWAPLSEATIVRRKAKGWWPGDILIIQRGRLASSIHRSAGRGYASLRPMSSMPRSCILEQNVANSEKKPLFSE